MGLSAEDSALFDNLRYALIHDVMGIAQVVSEIKREKPRLYLIVANYDKDQMLDAFKKLLYTFQG